MPYQLSIISVVFCRREPLFFMKVDIPVLHTAYAYDRAGNRTSVQAGDRRESYHYDRGRLTTRTVEHTQDPAGKTYTYRYDAQGNTLGDGENTYLYDCLNRIAEVQTKAGDIQKNHYDAEGLRSQMEENGKLVSFIYTDREVIAEEDEAGEHIRYIRGHELLASDSAHARTYYHYACDEMGSITDITDCHGTVLNHYAYDAFGNRTVEEETVENRFGFAGEILDAVTGQYYLRARFYNPVIARFLSEDTYYGDGLNLYSYCHNNPVRYVDPSGHLCEEKYNAVESLREQDGSNAADALKKYKELREQGYTPEQIKNGDYNLKFTADEVNKLKETVINEGQMLKDMGLSNKLLGPAIAGAYDRTTGKIYTAINDYTGNVPKELAPIIRERIKNMPSEVRNSYIKTKGPGTHAEVYAVNKLLLDNPNVQLSDIAVYVNRTLGTSKPVIEIPFETCPHCRYILKGFNIISND